MFGIGGWEFVIIAVVALLLFGPDKLPQVVRTVNRFVRDFKRYSAMMESTFKAELDALESLGGDDKVKKPNAEFDRRVSGGTFTRSMVATDQPSVPAVNQAPAAVDTPVPTSASEGVSASPVESASAPSTEAVETGSSVPGEEGQG